MDYLARTFDFDPNALNPAFAYWQRANGFWAYLPPVGYSPGVAQYWVGFLRGASISIDHQTNGELIAADLYDLCLVLAKEPDAWHMIKAAWELTIKPFHDLGPTPRSAFQRGLQAGMIVVAVVMLILAVPSLGKTAAGAIGALLRLPGIAARAARAAISSRAARGGGRARGGVTAGASGTDPPTGTQPSGVTAAASTSPTEGAGGVQPGGATGAAAALPETAPVEVPAVDGAAGAANKRPSGTSGGADPVEQSLGQVREDLAGQGPEGALPRALAFRPPRIVWIRTTTVRYSQRSAGGSRPGLPPRVIEVRRSMRKKGWDPNADPAQMVDGPEGPVTLDNTRDAVAEELGIEHIRARIHDPNEPMPRDVAYSERGRLRFGKFPVTYGEALAYRTADQKPPLPVTGTRTRPTMPPDE